MLSWLTTLDKLNIEETYLNIIKDICENPTANIILNGKKTESFSFKIKASMPTLTTYTKHSTGSPGQSN